MNQDDIFRLLLLVLLLANRQMGEVTDRNNAAALSDDDPDTTPVFSYTSINDLLIIFMIIKLFCLPADTSTDNANTTF